MTERSGCLGMLRIQRRLVKNCNLWHGANPRRQIDKTPHIAWICTGYRISDILTTYRWRDRIVV